MSFHAREKTIQRQKLSNETQAIDLAKEDSKREPNTIKVKLECEKEVQAIKSIR